jgi:sulfoxide reductase heme-binding subunit YedZ
MRRATLGGSAGEWRHRILRFHLPIGIASATVLALFMTLPTFDPQAYPQMDMGGAAALPQRPGEGGTMAHGAGQTQAPTGHGGSQSAPPAGGHGSGQATPTDHGGAQTTAPPSHSAQPAGPTSAGAMPDGRRFAQRLTVSTGYVATGLLAFTLLVGPANLMLRRRTPISSYLRRDAGMWTAVFTVVHVIYGSLLHSGGEPAAFLRYFFAADGSPLLNSFGLGNWTGLAALVIVAGLLALSSDIALRKLKAGPWKWLQRLNYALFALVVLHALFYGALLRATSPFTLLLGLSVLAVFVGQAAGIWLWRRRHARGAAPAAR